MKNKIINKLFICILILFCFVCLFGFNNEHFETSSIYTSIVIPYFNINFTVFTLIISISMLLIILLLKKIKINTIIILLLIRCILYFIPILYIFDGEEFKVGMCYAIIQCFFSFFIGINSEQENLENIIKVLMIYSIIICIEEAYTLLQHNISIFSNDLKWWMVIPLGRNNYITCVLIPTYALVSNYIDNNKLLKNIYFLIILFGVLATGSRLGLILYISYNIYNKLKEKKNKKDIMIFFSAIIIIFITFIVLGMNKYLILLADRFFSTSLYANRLQVYREAFEVFLNNPIFGRSAFEYSVYDVTKCHNFILESLVQTGIIGTIVYLISLGLVINKIKSIEDQRTKKSLMSFIVLWLLQGLLEPNLFGLMSDFYFWIILGIGYGIALKEKEGLKDAK